jgi:hypothetical protein
MRNRKFFTIRKDASFKDGLDIRNLSPDRITDYLHKFEKQKVMVCRLSNDDKPLIPTWTSPDNSSILV